MSPEVVRLLFAGGLSFLAGGAIGVVVTRAVYGEPGTNVNPAPVREKACAPCPECPLCPPPPDCGEHGLVPSSTIAPALLVPESEEPEQERRPGLPARAIQLATSQIRLDVAPCVEEAARVDARGTLLLQLTVTATGGQGFISDAAIAERSADARGTGEIEACLIEAARHTRFEWGQADGEGHFRLPVKLK